jgi:6-phosphogluconolactonase
MLTSVHARRAARGSILALATVAVASAMAAAPALAGQGSAKGRFGLNAVYTMTNNIHHNAILVFERAANGKLTLRQNVLTGGKGANNQPPFGFPIVDSSNSIGLSASGTELFAINSGDNSVSSFKLTTSGLKLVSHKSSGGNFPISLAVSGKLLYVLNEKSGSIAGLKIGSGGTLTPIPGSHRALSTPGPGGVAGQIGFNPGGKGLTVTLRGNNTIDTFKLTNGKPGPAVANTSTGNTPFGFQYAGNHLIMSNANVTNGFVGSASSYNLGGSGALSPISSTVASQGHATCWVQLSNNDKYAFMTDTLSGALDSSMASISRYAVGSDGKLTLLGVTASTAGFPTDEGLSIDGKYLYVLLPSNVVKPGVPNPTPAPATSHIDEFKVGPGGSLTKIGSTPANLPDGLSGLAAW